MFKQLFIISALVVNALCVNSSNVTNDTDIEMTDYPQEITQTMMYNDTHNYTSQLKTANNYIKWQTSAIITLMCVTGVMFICLTFLIINGCYNQYTLNILRNRQSHGEPDKC